MSELWRIILTSSLTIVGGVTVLVFGQIATKFFIEPLLRHRERVGSISHGLTYYASLYANPTRDQLRRRKRVHQYFRTQAAKLRAETFAIPWYGLWVKLGLVASLDDIWKVSSNLIGISNSLVRGDPIRNCELANEIERLLGVPWQEGVPDVSEPQVPWDGGLT